MLVSTAMDLSSLYIVKCDVATEGDIGVLQVIKCGATTEGVIRVSHTFTKMCFPQRGTMVYYRG